MAISCSLVEGENKRIPDDRLGASIAVRDAHIVRIFRYVTRVSLLQRFFILVQIEVRLSFRLRRDALVAATRVDEWKFVRPRSN